MIEISEDKFNGIVAEAIEEVPERYKKHLKNIAFIVEEAPSLDQRVNLGLAATETLFGLYEGVPLPQRGGQMKLIPDKITLFKRPIQYASRDMKDLIGIVKNTVWHEVAHFFGLDHLMIDEIEHKVTKKNQTGTS